MNHSKPWTWYYNNTENEYKALYISSKLLISLSTAVTVDDVLVLVRRKNDRLTDFWYDYLFLFLKYTFFSFWCNLNYNFSSIGITEFIEDRRVLFTLYDYNFSFPRRHSNNQKSLYLIRVLWSRMICFLSVSTDSRGLTIYGRGNFDNTIRKTRKQIMETNEW